ncbi:Krueppel homolog 1-like [Prorops nasuta]|uniref:Krueppel homolog 1-like n=1 Tax=Prorops nasuta TaxID=863751 RepID=UPI0034CE569F
MVGYYHTETMASQGAISASSGMTSSPQLVKLETMNSVKSLVCSPDLTVFAKNPGAQKSMSATMEKSPYQCLTCQKSFHQKSLYQSHIKSHSKEGEDPYRCNICSKTFTVPARLTRHYRTHTGEKPFPCDLCGKSFSVKENLSVHRRTHTKERPYKCTVCGRAFEHSGKLHRHMRIHTGERPHKCTVCSKTFIQSGQLVIHMRTHTGEKPYVCNTCKKGFTCSKQLKVHTRTHTGEKPYKCEFCGRAFGYNHVLKLHQISHFGEKVYKCTLCRETFGNKKTMEMHIKTHSENAESSPRDSPIEPVVEISQTMNGDPTMGFPAPSTTPGSCGSDKENSKTDEISEPTFVAQRDFYYLYPRDQYPQPVVPVNSGHLLDDRSYHTNIAPTPIEPPHPIFSYAEPAYSNFGMQNELGNDCSSLLNLPGNDARRRVEAALEAVEEERQREFGVRSERQETMLTPPSSNPVSPAPSPDPLDLVIPFREILILPHRKRTKMILESMEHESAGLVASQRQSSVIQFARAS